MDISVFEVIGPVMLGPSSSGTAGMARVGCAAHKFLTGELASIELVFHPRNDAYLGLRSHLALIGGAMGIPQDDPRLKDAITIAKEQGIELSITKFSQPLPQSGLTVALRMVQKDGTRCDITGISVGGGSLAITGIDGFSVELASTEQHLFVWAEKDIEAELQKVLPQGKVRCSKDGEAYLFYISVPVSYGDAEEQAAARVPGATRTLMVEPFLSFGYVPHKPLFTTYVELLDYCEKQNKTVAQAAVDYEMNRSGRTRQAIWDDMAATWAIMKDTVEKGMAGKIDTLFGFGSGVDGQKMMQALADGKTLSGSTVSRAIAKALTTMEMACSMNRMVAAPTAGSSGIVPGCLLTVQEDRKLSDQVAVEALFTAAAAGAVMYYHKASFSGMGGGCQSEIGVSSAIAAAALCHMGGGTPHQVVHAMALSMKNILGLICDRIGGSSEVPCIRRNGIGVANAFSGADMALAGIDSYVPPDEVIDALVDCQKRLPPELRGGCGGLASIPTAARARLHENEVNKTVAVREH